MKEHLGPKLVLMVNGNPNWDLTVALSVNREVRFQEEDSSKEG